MKGIIREAVFDRAVQRNGDDESDEPLEGFVRPGEGLLTKIWKIEEREIKLQETVDKLSRKLSLFLWIAIFAALYFLLIR